MGLCRDAWDKGGYSPDKAGSNGKATEGSKGNQISIGTYRT